MAAMFFQWPQYLWLMLILPLLPIGRAFGFEAPPPLFYVFLAGATATYLALVELTKRLFYDEGLTARWQAMLPGWLRWR
eukprot:gene45642-55867_t